MNNWDGSERRKENRKMDEDLQKLTTGLAVLNERMVQWMDGTITHRKLQLDKITELHDSIRDVKSNCILHLSNNKLFNQHLNEHKENRSFFKDKSFQLIIGIALLIIGAFIKQLYSETQKINAELRATIKANNRFIGRNP